MGMHIGRRRFIDHKENVPQEYYISLAPLLLDGFLTVNEYEYLDALEDALRAVWPTEQLPDSVAFLRPTGNEAQLQDLLGQPMALVVDGRTYEFNSSAAVDAYKPSMWAKEALRSQSVGH